MSHRNENGSPAADRELVQTRIFAAPREAVWTAWTEADGPHEPRAAPADCLRCRDWILVP